MDIPLVSVKLITFNHVKYIKQTIESIIAQEVSFHFEIVIGDDCSTDGTSEIIQRFAREYPTIIKAIISHKNYGAIKNAQDLNKYLKGKYVALCEGDDYWISKHKLEKQVRFLETHPDFSMCFHGVEILDQNNRANNSDLFSYLQEREYLGYEILKKWTVPTVSVVFRKEYYARMTYHKDYIYTDIALFLTLAEYGRIWCIKEKMAIYRRHIDGITQRSIPINERIAHFKAINYEFKRKYSRQINYIISEIYLTEAKKHLRKFSFKTLFSILRSIDYLLRSLCFKCHCCLHI